MIQDTLYCGDPVKVRWGDMGIIRKLTTKDGERLVEVQLRTGMRVTVPLAQVSRVRQLKVKAV